MQAYYIWQTEIYKDGAKVAEYHGTTDSLQEAKRELRANGGYTKTAESRIYKGKRSVYNDFPVKIYER